MTSIPHPHRISGSNSEMDHATPTKPAKSPARQGSINSKSASSATSNSSSASVSSEHLQTRTLLFGDSDKTPRKSSPLPTPPSSETTSNGSGSTGKGGSQGPNQSKTQELGESTSTIRSSSRPRSNTTSSSSSKRNSLSGGSDVADSSAERSKYNTLGGRRLGQRNALAESSSTPAQLSTAPKLHRKTSSMTVRSGSSSRDDPVASRSSSRTDQDSSLSRRGSVAEPRQRRSERYEQERAESRLGKRADQARSASRLGREGDEEEHNNRSSSSQVINSTPPKRRDRTSTVSTTGGDSTATDTSGTEGAGSVSGGRRRRKKSSASSRGKANPRKGRSSPARKTEDWSRDSSSSRAWPSHVRMESDGDDGLDGVDGSRMRFQPNGTSPGANSSLQTFPSQRSSQRSGIPQKFRQPSSASASTSRYRSDSIYDDQDEADESGWSRQVNAGGTSGLPPRRRHASDAQSAHIPTFEYQGRGGTKDSRLSVDSGAATRHLMRASSNGPDSFPTAAKSQQWDDLMSSPSEDARLRKVSMTSSNSNSNSNSNSRSSGGRSDHFRPSSRLSSSSRDPDVFGDGRAGYGRGSPALGDSGSKMERVESMQRRLAGLEAGSSRRSYSKADYDELRSGIERLPLVDSYASGSRSPSLASGSQPRSSSSAQFLDYHSQSRPSTEPRLQRNNAIFPEVCGSGLSLREREQAWNNGNQTRQSEDLNRGPRNFSMPLDRERAPATPDAGPSRPDSVTRVVQSATIPQSSRFSSTSSAQGSGRSGGGGDDKHVRLMETSFEMFRNHFSGGSSVSSPGASSNHSIGRESMELVKIFGDASSSIARNNYGLVDLQTEVLRARIATDTNPDYSSSSETLSMALEQIERRVVKLLQQSDDQVRLIAKGLIGFTKVEAEKDRLRRAATSENGSVSRPSSRMSSMSHSTQLSPKKTRDQERLERGHSIDLRASISSRAGRSSPTRNPTADWVSGRDGSERLASNSAIRDPSRRNTIGRAGALTGTGSPSFYSPSPRNGVQDFPSFKSGGSASRALTYHGRSASEITPETSSSRRGKASNGSNATTVRPPTSLSPRKPKLSFPSSSQSHATASFATSTHGSSELEFDANSSMDSAASIESGASSREGTLPRSLAKVLSARHGGEENDEFDDSSSRVSRRYTTDEGSRPSPSHSPTLSRQESSPSLSQRRSLNSNSSISPQMSPQLARSSNLSSSKRDSTGGSISGGSISKFFNSRSLGRSSGKRDSQLLSSADGDFQQPTSRRGSKDLASITRALQDKH